VMNMNCPMETNVTLLNVNDLKFKILQHAKHIKQHGESINWIIVVLAYKEYKECYKDLMKDILGNLIFVEPSSLMTMTMMKRLKFHECIFLDLPNFTVLKQFVHHVVWLLHGQNLTNQNHQPICLLYHPPTFHMESIWNGYIPWIPHGFHEFHMDSMWNMF